MITERIESASGRIAWVDMMRGFAMALIVLGHTLIGLLGSGLLESNEAARFIVYFIYLFHVPLILFVSGFVSKDRKKNWTAFVGYQLKWLIAPYFIWSFLLITMQHLSPSSANTPVGFSALPTLFWEPVAIFWFLYVFFWIKLVDYSVFCLWKKGGQTTSMVLMIASGVGYQLTYHLAFDAHLLPKFFLSLFFYEMGRFLSCRTEMLNRFFAFFRTRAGLGAVVPIAVTGLLAFFALSYVHADPATLEPMHDFQCYALLTGILGIIAMFFISSACERFRISAFIRFIGICSMAIYVQHTFWGAGIRSALAKAHVSSGAIYILAVAGGGLLLPIICEIITDRIGLTRFFGIRPVRKSLLALRLGPLPLAHK